MRFIRNHFMFILPLMAILLGVEFYLVFDRTTDSYEKSLQEGYAMMVVTKKPMKSREFEKLNPLISHSKEIEPQEMVSKISQGMSTSSSREILHALPHFYSLYLNRYVDLKELEKVKQDLEASSEIKKVETFGSSYESNYRLFQFIKLSLKIFIIFVFIVSLFLVIKQMQIWKYAHRQRMQVMEIFGAPLMLRSGVLFQVSIVDAIISTILTTLFFLYLKYQWVVDSGIEIMIKNRDKIFMLSDVLWLVGTALAIVVIAVYTVVLNTQEIGE